MEFIELKKNKTRKRLVKAISEKTTDSEKEVLLNAITILTKPFD